MFVRLASSAAVSAETGGLRKIISQNIRQTFGLMAGSPLSGLQSPANTSSITIGQASSATPLGSGWLA